MFMSKDTVRNMCVAISSVTLVNIMVLEYVMNCNNIYLPSILEISLLQFYFKRVTHIYCIDSPNIVLQNY